VGDLRSDDDFIRHRVLNYEGLETRFGVPASTLWATMTTDTSCGAVNAMLDSFNPIAGFVPMANMQTGEVIFGGVGAGLYGMLLFVILTVFIAGLMVGRTPEYLGKKIEGRQVKLAMLAALVFAVFPLVPTAVAVVLPAGLNAMNNAGPHGFSEIVYMFSSMTGNNGSAFAGAGSNQFTNLGSCAICRYLPCSRFFPQRRALRPRRGRCIKAAPITTPSFPAAAPRAAGRRQPAEKSTEA
jgi:K+-transporting ATPase A subunit